MLWLYLAIAPVALIIIVWFAYMYKVFRMVFARKKPKADVNMFPQSFAPFATVLQQGIAEFQSLPYETLSVTTKDGVRLYGYFLAADICSKRTAVLLHGYGGDPTERMYDALEFRKLGLNVFIPYVRAHGMSGGKYVGMGVADRRDVLAWLDLLTKKVGRGATFLLSGISMGGATMAAISGDEQLPSSVKVIFCDSGFTSVYDELSFLVANVPQPLRFLAVKTVEMWCVLFAKYNFTENSPLKQVAKSRTPTLFIHGTADSIVPFECGQRLFEACSAPKEMVTSNADHCLSYLSDIPKVRGAMVSFIEKYM